MLKNFGKQPSGEAWKRIRSSPNFDGRKFVNPIPTRMDMNPLRVIREYWQSDAQKRKPPAEVLVESWKKDSLQRPASKTLAITWLGHASLMLELDGMRILTDPVFSDTVSPVPGMGPSRLHPTPFPLDDTPPVDLILISHNHYDHLDRNVIEFFAGKDTRFAVPLAVSATLQYWGVPADRIEELDWHDMFEHGGLQITATPTRHFSGRGLMDRNRSLWTSYVIGGSNEKLFFCGDSGFFPGFKDIGQAHGPFDVTMVGIGAYNENWKAIHTTPEEAVEAHQLLRGKKLLPIHWCTFDLALHDWGEPIERLVKEAERTETTILLPKPGERMVIGEERSFDRWWE